MFIKTYKELLVWQKSIELVIKIYDLTKDFSKLEDFGLTSQMRRSSISIPSNIAEGKMRLGKKEFRRFLLIAYGSGAELETQLEISKKLSIVDIAKYKDIEDLLTEIMKMINKMTCQIKSNIISNHLIH